MVSTDASGIQGSYGSRNPAISADGRYIAFESGATNLVSPDTNDKIDTFRKDTHTGEIVRVSTAGDGSQAVGGDSGYPSISADGRFVAFNSGATNLLGPGQDTNGKYDIFVKDLQTGFITRVSTAHMSNQQISFDSYSPSISADGRFIAFHTQANDIHCRPGFPCFLDPDLNWDVFVKDTQTNAITRASSAADWTKGNNPSSGPSISADGRYVAFQSLADNLLGPGGDTNALNDVYVKDIQTGAIQRVSTRNMSTEEVGADSTEAAISADGRYVSFSSRANDIHCRPGFPCFLDPDLNWDVFVKDTQTNTITRASSAADFTLGNGDSSASSISADGRYVAFMSIADNLLGAGGDTNLKPDIFTKDTRTGAISLISVSARGVQSDYGGEHPDLSADGRFVGFDSFGSNLIPGDANADYDVLTAPAGRNYLFSWYDNVGGDSWILMANPASASDDGWFDLSVAGSWQSAGSLDGYDPGQVPVGMALTPKYPGLMGGPVYVRSITGAAALVSQRTLWPKGGSSIEEVVGTDTRELSSHFYWTWYDMQSPGYVNWILVSNPGADRVYYDIEIGGVIRDSGYIDPGSNKNVTFPGMMDGPVEVSAWTSVAKTVPAYVYASQRVLSGGNAFNEVIGVPEEYLATNFFWPWYDNVYGQNWILAANPDPYNALRVEIRIGGNLMNDPANPGNSYFDIPAGGIITPAFPGIIGGPVEIRAYDPGGSWPATAKSVIASQRMVFGPSFGETVGYPPSAITDEYHWTWYDMATPGMQNWIMVTNPGSSTVTYTIKFGGTPVFGYTDRPLEAGAIEAPIFPGVMEGPVEVTSAGGTIITSQRVLYNGYFNEVLGTKLD